MRMGRWGWLGLLALLLGGCATTSDRMYQLDTTLRAYENALRWSNFDLAYSFQRPDLVASGHPRPRAGIRVSAYEVINQQPDKDGLQVAQTVQIRYYHLDSARERSLIDRQRWAYAPEHKRWFLASSPPAFE